jgi:hypothetical protein
MGPLEIIFEEGKAERLEEGKAEGEAAPALQPPQGGPLLTQSIRACPGGLWSAS